MITQFLGQFLCIVCLCLKYSESYLGQTVLLEVGRVLRLECGGSFCQRGEIFVSA